MRGFLTKLILPLIVVVVAVCGLLARNNTEQWKAFYAKAQRLYDAGYYAESLEAASRSLEKAEGWFGLGATYKSDSLNLMGLNLDEMERYGEAEAAYRRALQLEERAWGREGNLDYAVVLDNYAMSCNEQGRHEEAIALAQEALAIWEKLSDVRRVHSLITLTSALSSLENYEQAALYAQMAVQVLEAEQPEDEKGLVNALHWQGDVYYMLDRYEEAEVVLLRALELAMRAAPSEVNDVADCTADALLAQDKTTEAEALYLRAIAFLEALPRPDAVAVAADGSVNPGHPDTWLSALLTNFGNFYLEIDKHDKAAEQYRRAGELDARIYGEDHYYVVIDWNDLGVAHELGGNYARAEEAYLRALAILDGWETADNDMLFSVLQNLVDTYEKSGQLDRLAPIKERMQGLLEEPQAAETPQAEPQAETEQTET